MGSPIRPDLRVEHLELVQDSGEGLGYRINGTLHPLKVPREVAMPHEGGGYDEHVHNEVAGLVAAVEMEGPRHPESAEQGGCQCHSECGEEGHQQQPDAAQASEEAVERDAQVGLDTEV